MPSSVPRLAQATQLGIAAELGQRQSAEERLGIPLFEFPVLHRVRLTELINRAARHQAALVSGPAGAGKTVACASWAVTQSEGRQVLWLTLSPGEDSAWFWADVYARLRQASVLPREAVTYLEEGPANRFPFRLAEMARQFTVPVTLVLDNVHALTDEAIVSGLDVLLSLAPPTLSVLFCGRRATGAQLDRLRASGELATVGPADLACTSEEADAYLTMLGLEFAAADRDKLLTRAKGLIGALAP
jgi:LuxR family maltose regulon positive regulatory protein